MNDSLRQRNIVLIGPMAAGKSTIGAQLARLMGREFIDSDQLFEAKHGPIPEAFNAYGEHWFRQVEARIVATLLADGDGQVVSLGGGAVLDTGTQQLLAQCTVVFLEIDAESVRERIVRAGNRPLLHSAGVDPVQRWSQVLADREFVYRKAADLILDVRSGSADELAATLLTLVETRADKEVL